MRKYLTPYNPYILFMSLTLFLTMITGGIGCNCGDAPILPEGITQDGIIKHDGLIPEDAASDDISPQDVAPSDISPDLPQPDLSPPDDTKCVNIGDPCHDSFSCIPSCSGKELKCIEGRCLEDTPPPDLLPDFPPPPDITCPQRCSSHNDCMVPGCGDRIQCVNSVCSVPPKPCPNTCNSDVDCQTPLCGSRIQCINGVCSTPPSCPDQCISHSDCQQTACGPRQMCLKGVCAEPPPNNPPTAVAEKSQTVEVGNRVQLDGSKSSDPDKDPLTFLWTFISKPANSKAAFDDPTSVTPAFIPDVAGDYSIALIVNDGKVDSPPATVLISAFKKILPPPSLSSFSPPQMEEGSANLTLKLFGNNFDPGSEVSFNNSPLKTTVVNDRELAVTIPANLKAASYPVFVKNSDGQISNTLYYKIVPRPNDPPVLQSISPVEEDAGKPFTLKLYGDKFIAGAEIYLNNTVYSTTFISAKELTASIPALVEGSYSVQVSNPDGLKSDSLSLKIVTIKKGPILLSIQPQSVFAQQNYSIVVLGERFANGAVIILGGGSYAAKFISDKELEFNIRISAPGNFSFEVANPDGLRSNRMMLEVKPPLSKPSITQLQPASVQELTPITIAIIGADFAQGATATVGSQPYQVSFVSNKELRLTLPNTIKAGTYPVQVTNPDKQQSNIINLNVTPAPPKPLIDAIKPNRIPEGAETTVIVVGKYFIKGAQVQIGTRLVSTTFVSDTELSIRVPNNFTAGTYKLQVINPGNVTSNAVDITVFKAPPPQITSLVPNSGISGSVLTVRIVGSNFVNGAVGVFHGGEQPTTFVSDGELNMTLSLSSLNPATYNIWVRNPDGQVSNRMPFIIEAPKGPQISQLLPREGATNTKVAGIISGERFAQGATVSFVGKTIATTYLNSSTLGITYDLSNIAAGTYPLQVSNPDGQKSNVVYFTVTAQKLPAPVLTQVIPTTISLSKTQTIYLLGSHFQNGAMMMISMPFGGGDIGLPTNYINSQTLVVTAVLPSIPFPFPPQRTNVFVQNPDNQRSNSVSVTISP